MVTSEWPLRPLTDHNVHITIIPNDKSNPPRKFTDAEYEQSVTANA